MTVISAVNFFKSLQTEHKAWLDREFPGQLPEHAAAGVVEEAAELLHAVLKLTQSHVWGPELRYRDRGPMEHRELIVDAIGDAAVFLCSLCDTMGWDFADIATSFPVARDESWALRDAVQLVRRAVDLAVLVILNKQYAKLTAELFAKALRECALALSVDFETAVSVTWNEVKQRSHA